MADYPLVSELPEIVDAQDWDWAPFDPPNSGARFFTARDPDGNRWITKMRGSFRGYRELVFERIVQRSGWFSQSSCFAVLHPKSLPRRSLHNAERIQLITRFLDEHQFADCGPHCPIAPLRDKDLWELSNDPLQLLADSGVEGAVNKAVGEILAPVLGGLEPAQCLTTTDHRKFLIDGEQMFLSGPSDPAETGWWNRPDGSPYERGRQLTFDVCKSVGTLSDSDLEAILARPSQLRNRGGWPIRPLLYKARDHARFFALDT